MKLVFGFSLRFFIAFVAAKLILGRLGADTPGYLVVLTSVFVINTYLFDFLEYFYRGRWRQSANPRTASQARSEEATPDSIP